MTKVTRVRRLNIQQLLLKYDIETAEDIQDALKDRIKEAGDYAFL